MNDPIWISYLRDQEDKGRELAAASDILTLEPFPLPTGPPTHYRVRFVCTGVVCHEDGLIAPQEGEFVVGIAFAHDHLRYVDPLRVVTWLGPWNVVAPNILPPLMCVGHVLPGIGLVDLCYQVYDIITFNNWSSADALNGFGAQWARASQHLFPVDRRPLRRRVPRNVRRSPRGDA